MLKHFLYLLWIIKKEKERKKTDTKDEENDGEREKKENSQEKTNNEQDNSEDTSEMEKDKRKNNNAAGLKNAGILEKKQLWVKWRKTRICQLKGFI